MELIIVAIVIILLAVLANAFGTDSRDGRPNW